MNYKNKKIAVIGYGIEGKDAVRFLKSKGAQVTILDQKYGDDYLNNLKGYDIVVRSPGVYRFKEEIVKAEQKGVRITSPIHIFFDEFPGSIIGVTGTKGKGTTSTLIYKILKKAGFDVYLAGNIGKPYLKLLPKLTAKTYVIMEMSSFQLIDLPVSPDIAVVLNITSDHMDWHKNQNEYVEAKLNIVRHLKTSDWAVINKQYDTPKSFAKKTAGNVMFFSKETLDDDLKKDLKLRGEHNLENISAAVSVAKILNIKADIIKKSVTNFKGLEHRLELVREFKGVRFYNDSFATGPQPTIAAINSFSEPITIILGGSDKGLDYDELGKAISENLNVKNIVLIGQIREQIKKSILKFTKQVEIFDLGVSPMTDIVEKAFRVTENGGVVILSPAAASFDMFKNYKDRGKQFKKTVNSLK